MKAKLIGFVITTLMLIFIGAIHITLASKQGTPAGLSSVEDSKLTIKDRVKKAKAIGSKQVFLPAGSQCYAEIGSLEEALINFNIVIAEPIERLSYTTPSRNISTWYKFRVIQTLSKRTSTLDCAYCSSSSEIPKELLPVYPNEILVPQAGGEIVIDGIKVTQRSGLPAIFSMNFSLQEMFVDNSTASATEDTFKYHESISTSRRYLLFLLPSSNDNAVAFLDIGPSGIFNISSENVIESMSNNSDVIGVSSLFGNSLDKLIKYIKQRGKLQ